MISLVIVSHSAKLADGVCDLVRQVGQGQVPVATAGGTDNAAQPIGTDAFKVLQAIRSVMTSDGVLVLMDLGSAVLSAETALDLLDAEERANVRLCAAPLVEGSVAAASQILAGAGLDEVMREAGAALTSKQAHVQSPTDMTPSPAASTMPPDAKIVLVMHNRLGLHARPAAQFVRTASRFQAQVSVFDVTTSRGPVPATSISQVLGLGVRQSHQIALSACGIDAKQALDALAALVDTGFGESEQAIADSPSAQVPAPVQPMQDRLAGMPGAPGIAIGPLVQLRPKPIHVDDQRVAEPRAQWQRLLAAIGSARQETEELQSWAQAHVGVRDAAIFDAHLLLLDDAAVTEAAAQLVHQQHMSAQFAWQTVIEGWAERLRRIDDPYLQARAADVADVGQRVLRHLSGAQMHSIALPEPAIVAAHDLAPSDVKQLDLECVLGLCLQAGSATAHSVILARALGIPVVVGLGTALSTFDDGVPVAMDGQQGIVWIAPDTATQQALVEQRGRWLAARREANVRRHEPAMTNDGTRVRVLANISSIADAQQAHENGADGVGLLRTELLFADRDAAPSEEAQTATYAAIADILGVRPLTIRTLDVGGDKPLSYAPMGKEDNPFLGRRGIRISLWHPDLLKTQLRAILRASPGHAFEIMFPMVATPGEVRAVKAVLAEARAELLSEGVAVSGVIKIGAMIEVPAAVAVADQLAAEVDFFSIGSNDLCQYVMAADRGNPGVAALADAWQPAVLRMIHQVIGVAKSRGIGIALCGELAGDTLATPLLLGMGLRDLSVSPPAVASVKQAISRLNTAEAQAIVPMALALDSSLAVRQLLRERFPL